MITTISIEFYNTLKNKPPLLSLDHLNLKVNAANGEQVPYQGYVEARLKVPFLKNKSFDVPVLVVPMTENNKSIPVIIGTNFIRLCKEGIHDNDMDTFIPEAWNMAIDSLAEDSVGLVKSTQRYTLKPFETRTISGFVRKTKEVNSAVTEPCSDDHCSTRVSVCPRVVTLNKPGKTTRVPVRIFNMSAKSISIPAKSNVCELHEVSVLREAPVFEQEVTKASNTASIDKQTIQDDEQTSFGVELDHANLSTEEKEKVHKLFSKWQHIFSKDPCDLGHTDLIEHEIHLSDAKPFKEPHRNIPTSLLEEVRQHIKEMIDCGAIRESNSPYSSNVVIVRKKDGTIRFCIDFRKLNQRTIKDAYAIPRIENTLHLLSGSRYFSKLDLRSGYWQVSVKEEDKPKTAFTVGSLGFYECNRMPFGLTNAPATFQRLMERCMGELNLRDCLIYLDDVIIFSATFDQHLERLEAVFSRLAENNLKLKPSKCEFFKSKVTYLGHVVSEEGIQADPDKIEAIASWPIPKTTKDVRKFLGFTGYYRRFIKNYATIVRPLNDLLI